MQDLIAIGLRVSVMYFYALVLLRLSGKRALKSIAPHDFVMTIVIGDMFDDVFWAEVPLATGFVGMGSILFLHTFVSYLTYRSMALHAFVNSTPTRLIRNGRIDSKGQHQTRLPRSEIFSGMRLQKVQKIDELEAAYLETNGHFSMMRKPREKPAQKHDLVQIKGNHHE